MKLQPTLRSTCELHTDLSQEAAAEQLLAGQDFTGTRTEESLQLNHRDKNPFRPEITVRLVPDEEGTLVWTSMRLHPAMIAFLCIWSVVVIALAVWKGLLLLVMVPVFWLIAVIAFSIGVSKAKQAMLACTEAYEITG